MKTYLVTGGAGFIGSTLCERLIKLGNKVIVIDNFCDFYNPELKRMNVEELKQFVNNNTNYNDIKIYECDIRDKEGLNRIFGENKIDIVIHLAAMAGVRPSIENSVLYQEVNCIGTQNLLEAMRIYGVSNLVMASSSSVYGNCKETPFKEDMIVDYAISPYAATKKANEVMTHVYHSLYNMNVIMLRLFTVYGPKQRPDLAINKFTKCMLNGEAVTVYGDGTTARDYTYVDDIVDGFISACNYVSENSDIYEIINLGNSSPVCLKDMIQTIGKVLGVEPKLKYLPMQAGDVDITFADISKARRLLGYEPKVKFEDGVRRFAKWYKDYGVEKCR